MKEENKKPQRSTAEEETKKTKETNTTSSVWKSIIKKKWFFPAIYLAAAALILAFIAWYQSPGDYALDVEELGYDSIGQEGQFGFDEDVPVAGEATEAMQWPIADEDEQVKVVVGYFDDQASTEEQEQSMIEYDQAYHPSRGLNLAREDGETFEVLASLSGTITSVHKDPLVGNVIEIAHEDELVTIYQSLEDIQVAEGDQIEKGELIGYAGRSVFRKDLGKHVHFEVRDNDQIVNPNDYLSE